ncbi:interferon-inducible GTPase 5-like [Neolamprologus brichardi]|uniref:interferon-inducible GTPase 5-like n=1 Tax=Neolamprologus brichardi TaxID=32507 RepID=UPI0016438671|nr:interferon-inducible GTPase 5-like [Neolamprologus brichardi]
MTKLAAEEELCDAERFSDVIDFDVQEDVKYCGQLWEGSPPTAAPNPAYSESLQEVKNTILSKASKSAGITLSQLRTKIQDLWNALLSENFVFSVKNTLEVVVYRKLEALARKQTWILIRSMKTTEDQLFNTTESGTLYEAADQHGGARGFNESEEIPGHKEDLQHKDTAAAAAKIQQHLEKQDNIPLNIAITGESGSGKSTFVNAFRGVSDDEEGAAPTGVKQTTPEVTAYPHPNYSNVTLWDLPGIGTTKFPADKYLKLVGFEKFDFFIIISDTRFTENDVKLAKEIQKMKKKFYFVHSKIDNDINAERRKRDFSAERTLKVIRDDCVHSLQGIKSPRVFLVSSFKQRWCDFSLLQETLERELPMKKRDALLCAMLNINPEIINKKKQALKSKIKYWATLSAAGAAVPLPGLSIAVDAALLVGAVTHYVFVFGLDILSLKRLSNRTGVPYADLCAVIISPLAAVEITTELLLRVIAQAEEASRFTPLTGIPVAMSLSSTTTSKVLNVILNQLADDAHRVFEKALEL